MKNLREYLEEQINENLIQAVLSAGRNKDGISKIKIRPIRLKGQICYQASATEGQKVLHKNYGRTELIEYVEKEWIKQPHVGELPLDIVAQVVEHGDKAVAAIDKAAAAVTRNKEEFGRLQNDMHCYREFAYAFNLKVKAAQRVLNYQWGKDLNELDAAIPLMEQSLYHSRKLVALTYSTY